MCRWCCGGKPRVDSGRDWTVDPDGREAPEDSCSFNMFMWKNGYSVCGRRCDFITRLGSSRMRNHSTWLCGTSGYGHGQARLTYRRCMRE